MSGHGWFKGTLIVCTVCVWVWGAMGCASSKGATASAASEVDREVKYGPPEEDRAPEVPGGAPVLPEYEVMDSESYARAVSAKTYDKEVTSQPGSGQVTRADLVYLVERGPGWGLVHVKVRPVKSDSGSLIGYEVVELTESAAIWLTPGLSVGDQITHLNGVQIRTPDDYMEAWNLARDADEVRIDFIREGEANYSSWSIVEQ